MNDNSVKKFEEMSTKDISVKTNSENNTSTITPTTHKFPDPPIHTTSEMVDTETLSLTAKAWELYHEDVPIHSGQEVYGSLIKAKVEIETCLTGRELLKQGIVSLKKKDTDESTDSKNINSTTQKIDNLNLNLRSVVQSYAKSLFSYHRELLSNAIIERERKYSFLKYFHMFERDKMKIKIGDGRMIDLSKGMETDANDENPENNISVSSEEKALQFLLESLNMLHFVRLTVKFLDLQFESQIKLKSIKEVKKLFEIEKIREWGNLRVEIDIPPKMDENNQMRNLQSETSETISKSSEIDQKLIEMSETICKFVYNSLLGTFPLISLFEVLSVYRAIQFFETGDFIRLKYAIKNGNVYDIEPKMMLDNMKLVFFFIKENDKLRIEIEKYDMKMFFNERIVEYIG